MHGEGLSKEMIGMACRNHPNKREWNGNTGICNDCAMKEGKRLYNKQGKKCDICGKFLGECDASGNVPRTANLDHNHHSGQVRGVLCRRCNLGLGYFRDPITKDDNPDLLSKAVAYLEKWKQIARE